MGFIIKTNQRKGPDGKLKTVEAFHNPTDDSNKTNSSNILTNKHQMK